MKRERFKSLAESRTQRALKQIKLIGNLANQSAYEYGDDDVRAIFGALEQEMKQAKNRFSEQSREDSGPAFSLS